MQFRRAFWLPQWCSRACVIRTWSSATQQKSSAALPTGDSLIDVAGQPGPMGIGSLLKNDVSDIEHRKWLQQEATAISALIKEEPARVPDRCRQGIDHLKQHTHGSIFFTNIKQLRNACTRQLARKGEIAAALDIFADPFRFIIRTGLAQTERPCWTIQGRLEANA